MNPVEKMNELQRRVDAVNHRVMKKREQLMKPTKKQMETPHILKSMARIRQYDFWQSMRLNIPKPKSPMAKRQALMCVMP